MKRLIAAFILFAGFMVNGAFAESPFPPFGVDSIAYLDYFDSAGPRPAGTPEEKAAADYIAGQLQSMGYAPERQAFTQTVTEDDVETKVSSENIICVKKGVLAKEIIVAAHYDCVVDGNGSDDNASGIALLLEMCKTVKDKALPFTVKLIFFGAEEPGEVGSKYFVKGMTKSGIYNTLAVLNFDSLIAGDKLYVHGDFGKKGKARDWMLTKAKALGIPLFAQTGKNKDYPAGTTGDWGDHAPFQKAGIQYAAFEVTDWSRGDLDGYTQTDPNFGEDGEIWHTKFDTFVYIETTFPGRIKEHMISYAKLLYAFLTGYK